MKTTFTGVLLSAALVGLLAFSQSAVAQQKTVKQCNEEWTAGKAAIQASGKTKKDFVAECRGGTAAAAPAPATTPAAAPANPPAAAAPSAVPPAAAAPAKRRAVAAPAAPAAPSGEGQFPTEAEAKAHCPGDTVVWANLTSKVYHFSASRVYGKTKKGAYMCEKESVSAGFRASKNEKRA
jgi:hypothetical protein